MDEWTNWHVHTTEYYPGQFRKGTILYNDNLDKPARHKAEEKSPVPEAGML